MARIMPLSAKILFLASRLQSVGPFVAGIVSRIQTKELSISALQRESVVVGQELQCEISLLSEDTSRIQV